MDGWREPDGAPAADALTAEIETRLRAVTFNYLTIDDATLEEVDRVGKPRGLKRSEIVRQALHDWLRKNAVEGFEQEWITALNRTPDEATRAERWISTEALWKWIDAHSQQTGIGRPYLDKDPPHIAPIDGKEYADHRGLTKRAALEAK